MSTWKVQLSILCVVNTLCCFSVQASEWKASVVASKAKQNHVYVKPARWDDFRAQWKKLEKRGYRLADFEATYAGKVFFSGVFVPPHAKTAYKFGASLKDFRAFADEMHGKGYRLYDFEPYTDGKRQLFGGIFRKADYKFGYWFIDSWDGFRNKWVEWEKKGLRMIDFETWVVGDKRWYGGVFRKAKYKTAWQVHVSWDAFSSKWKELAKKGYHIIDMEVYKRGNSTQYAALYGKTGSPQKLWSGASLDQVKEKMSAWSKQGYVPRDIEVTWVPGPSKPAQGGSEPKSKPIALTFKERRVRDSISGLEFPDDMPSIRYPTGFKHCSEADKQVIRQAWAMAHYYMWRGDQVMDWLGRNDKRRKAAWSHGYDKNVVGKTYDNYSPRAWFGPYDGKRFKLIDGGIDKVWSKRFRGKTFTVKCRVNGGTTGAHPCFQNNPGGDGTPSANHIVYGTINFCDKFFAPRRSSDPVYVQQRAITVVHEMFHHLSLSNGWLVTDTHTHCDGGKCRTQKMYGMSRASHLSHVRGVNAGHYKRAVRNNDNYAYSIGALGAWIYNGSLISFPAPGFKY